MKQLFTKNLAIVIIVLMSMMLFSGCRETVTYTVSFDSFGGAAVESQTVKDGECAQKPEDPEKEGFTFVEWQLDNSTYDFSTAVTSDITLTAYYTINEGTEIVLITLDYQNGDMSNIVEIQKGNTLSEPPVPKKAGYKFVGWYLSDAKFDFLTEINDNITLTAKWEIDQKAQSSTSDKNIISSNVSEPTSTETTNETARIDKIVSKYTGRWYLSGYSDVCIDVYKYKNYDAMIFEAYGFSLYWDNFLLSEQPTDKKYEFVVYPRKNCTGIYDSYSEILYENFDKLLSEHKIVLGNDCFYINNNKFIKTPGAKDKYSDTCYPEALGTWYLFNTPTSKIEITTESKSTDLVNGDRVKISFQNFNFSTFDTNVTGSDGGDASLKSTWDNLGISVKDDTLTVTNSKGTRKFYKTLTYQKVTGVSLSSSNIELGTNDTHKLTATIAPADAYEKTVTWSSSNESVATVAADGTVTAKTEGTAKIIATTKDGNYTASCDVKVSLVHVSGVSLNHTSLDMIIGNNVQLTATIAPSDAYNKNIVWSSSNKSIADVSSSGVVTPKKKGTAIITATTSDGGYTASCTVTVKEPALTVEAEISVGTISTNGSSVRSILVKAVASGGSGEYVEYLVMVYRNGVLIGEENDDTISVTPAASGTYTAVVYVVDSSGNVATHTKTVTLS